MSWFKFFSQSNKLDLLRTELLANAESRTAWLLDTLGRRADRIDNAQAKLEIAVPLLNAQLAKLCEAQGAILGLLKQQTALIVEVKDKISQLPEALKPKLEALAAELSHVRGDLKELAGKTWAAHASTVKEINLHTNEAFSSSGKNLQATLLAHLGSSALEIKGCIKAQVVDGAGQVVQGLGAKLDAAGESLRANSKASQEAIDGVCNALAEELKGLHELVTEIANQVASMKVKQETPMPKTTSNHASDRLQEIKNAPPAKAPETAPAKMLFDVQVRISDGAVTQLAPHREGRNDPWGSNKHRVERRSLSVQEAEDLRRKIFHGPGVKNG